MSENGADVSWNDVGKVLEDERSSVEDIQTDLARNNKGNICQSIDNCMTVFQRDPLLKGAIRKNELSGKIDIVGNLGWERTSSSLTDTDVYQLHWYLEKEYGLADLIINLEDIILAIQLKERNEKDRTQDKNIEEKWLKKKCKKAKEQIKDTISYITSEKVSFINARGKKTIINPNAEVVPLVVFENDSISEYEHLLRNHTNDGLAVNCMSIYDFKLMCKQLLSPIEIIEYLKWREVFYKNNGPINLLITETNNGFVLSKPQKNENLVQQYLYEKYGENAIYEDRLYYELFRQYVLVLYEHKEIESEINGCYEVIKFLAHLFRDEIKCFVERTEKALLIAKTKKFNLVGTLRNVQKEYAIVFTATEQIPSEKLLPVVFEKQKVHTLLQVITYWVNDNEYMIDFVLWQG